jgi:hypothetical protein
MGTTDHSHASPGTLPQTPPKGLPLNHEPTDVSLKGVGRIAILSYVILFVILVLVYGVWKGMQAWASDSRQMPPMSAYADGKERLPRGPLVLTDEPGYLRELRKEEHEILEKYGWVDKTQGIVRVPIARAIEMLAEHPEKIAPGDGGAAAAPAPAAEPAPGTPPPAAH